MTCATCNREHSPQCHEVWVIYSYPVSTASVQFYPQWWGWTAHVRQAVLRDVRQKAKKELQAYRASKGSGITPDQARAAIERHDGCVADAARALNVTESYLKTFIRNYQLGRFVYAARKKNVIQHGKERKGDHGPEESLNGTRETYQNALVEAGGKITRAAHFLGISLTTMQERIDRHDLRGWLRTFKINASRRVKQ